ncbi:MAG: hypothetical protein ACREP9_18795 [Candidatus Dormibacteraceae bacterium]
MVKPDLRLRTGIGQLLVCASSEKYQFRLWLGAALEMVKSSASGLLIPTTFAPITPAAREATAAVNAKDGVMNLHSMAAWENVMMVKEVVECQGILAKPGDVGYSLREFFSKLLGVNPYCGSSVGPRRGLLRRSRCGTSVRSFSGMPPAAYPKGQTPKLVTDEPEQDADERKLQFERVWVLKENDTATVIAAVSRAESRRSKNRESGMGSPR